MTKKERATRRYIFAELRKSPLVERAWVPRSGHDKGNIMFSLAIREKVTEAAVAAVKDAHDCYSTGLFTPAETEHFARYPKALSETLKAKLFCAFLGYLDLLEPRIAKRLGIKEWE